MKMIHAYIQPFMSEKVADALRQAGVDGVTMLACQGFGRTREGQEPYYLDETTRLGFAPKCKIEIVCSESSVPRVVEIIRQAAHTGRAGDGRIFVCDVSFALAIRSGVMGEDAL